MTLHRKPALGEVITGDMYRRLEERVRLLENTTAASPLELVRQPTGRHFRLQDLGIFPAKITDFTSGTGWYSWKEQQFDATGARIDAPAGRQGFKQGPQPAREINGVQATVPSNVWMRRTTSATSQTEQYEFLAGCGTCDSSGTGSIGPGPIGGPPTNGGCNCNNDWGGGPAPIPASYLFHGWLLGGNSSLPLGNSYWNSNGCPDTCSMIQCTNEVDYGPGSSGVNPGCSYPTAKWCGPGFAPIGGPDFTPDQPGAHGILTCDGGPLPGHWELGGGPWEGDGCPPSCCWWRWCFGDGVYFHPYLNGSGPTGSGYGWCVSKVPCAGLGTPTPIGGGSNPTCLQTCILACAQTYGLGTQAYYECVNQCKSQCDGTGLKTPSNKTILTTPLGSTSGSAFIYPNEGGLGVDSSGAAANLVPVTDGSGGFTITTPPAGTQNVIAQAAFNSSVGNSGSGETDIYSTTLTAGLFATNKDFLNVEYTAEQTAFPATVTFKVYVAGSVIATLVSNAATVIQFSVQVIRVDSSTLRCAATYDNAAAGTINTEWHDVTGLTLSNTQIVKLTIQGSASNQGFGRMGIISWMAHP